MKIVLVGNSELKQEFFKAFKTATQNDISAKTLGLDFCLAKIEEEDIQLWNTPSDLKYFNISVSYFKDADAVIMFSDENKELVEAYKSKNCLVCRYEAESSDYAYDFVAQIVASAKKESPKPQEKNTFSLSLPNPMQMLTNLLQKKMPTVSFIQPPTVSKTKENNPPKQDKKIVLIGTAEDKSEFTQRLKSAAKQQDLFNYRAAIGVDFYKVEIDGINVQVWDAPTKLTALSSLIFKDTTVVINVSPQEKNAELAKNIPSTCSVVEFDLESSDSAFKFVASLISAKPKFSYEPASSAIKMNTLFNNDSNLDDFQGIEFELKSKGRSNSQ